MYRGERMYECPFHGTRESTARGGCDLCPPLPSTHGGKTLNVVRNRTVRAMRLTAVGQKVTEWLTIGKYEVAAETSLDGQPALLILSLRSGAPYYISPKALTELESSQCPQQRS